MLQISSTTPIPTLTPSLIAGQLYTLQIDGTYTYAPGGRIADAEFAWDPDAAKWLEELPGVVNQEFNLDLLLDGTPRDWLGSADGVQWTAHTFSPTHQYRLAIIGQGSPVALVVYDSSHDWNEGHLTVTIVTPVPEPASLVIFSTGLPALLFWRRQTIRLRKCLKRHRSDGV